jgi:hypothetical protein
MLFLLRPALFQRHSPSASSDKAILSMPPLFQLNGLGSCGAKIGVGAKRQLPRVERSASLASTNHPHGNGKKAVPRSGSYDAINYRSLPARVTPSPSASNGKTRDVAYRFKYVGVFCMAQPKRSVERSGSCQEGPALGNCTRRGHPIVSRRCGWPVIDARSQCLYRKPSSRTRAHVPE